MNDNNNNKNKSPHAEFKDMADDVVAMKILDIIEKSPHVTQRSIKYQTGLAAGLVHSYMSKVINKGWVKAKQVSARRWLYYLTPEGFLEKSRLTIKYLSITLSNYREAQNLVKENLHTCLENGWRQLLVAGENDLAEISAINIKALDGLNLAGVVSGGNQGQKRLAGIEIKPFESIDEIEFDRILICDISFIQWLREQGRDDKAPYLLYL